MPLETASMSTYISWLRWCDPLLMMNIMKPIILLFTLFIIGCAATQKQPDTRALAQQYFAIYAERQDFEALMAMYDDKAVLEDMIYGFYAKDKSVIRAFFNWHDGHFELPSGPPALVVEKQAFDGTLVITEGHFTRFKYKGKAMGPWRFVIWLEFNEQGKIIRQVDWINYTPRKDFLGGKNMNKEL